jgi:hypothetical protein
VASCPQLGKQIYEESWDDGEHETLDERRILPQQRGRVPAVSVLVYACKFQNETRVP